MVRDDGLTLRIRVSVKARTVSSRAAARESSASHSQSVITMFCEEDQA